MDLSALSGIAERVGQDRWEVPKSDNLRHWRTFGGQSGVIPGRLAPEVAAATFLVAVSDDLPATAEWVLFFARRHESSGGDVPLGRKIKWSTSEGRALKRGHIRVARCEVFSYRVNDLFAIAIDPSVADCYLAFVPRRLLR